MRRRQGFTLVELLVAMALILFIMAILSQAFVSATNTFRNLKAAGDMAEKLRATTQLLQRDLAADHFEGKKRLSDPTFWQNGPPQQGFFQIYQGSAQTTPDGTVEGADIDSIGSYRNTDHALAFTIKQRGNQMGDFLSASAPLLARSVNFGPSEVRYQSTSGGSYNYQWAEVAWFLQPSINPVTGQQDMTAADPSTGAAGVPLYTLYRRQRLAVPDNSQVTPAISYNNTNYAQCLELSCWNNGGSLYFNSPTDLTAPQRRCCGIGNPLGGGSLAAAFTTSTQDLSTLGIPNPTLAGADIQLTDVVSFDVRVLTPDTLAATLNVAQNTHLPFIDPFVTLGTINVLGNTYFNPNSKYQYTSPLWVSTTSAMVFDTWSSLNDAIGPNYLQWNNTQAGSAGNVVPFWSIPSDQVSVPTGAPTAPIIQAIQITIRIWDQKTNQTRQVTIVQAM
jgi:prepilin-type N-terminal cleavage/methylation domain-containing protein